MNKSTHHSKTSQSTPLQKSQSTTQNIKSSKSQLKENIISKLKFVVGKDPDIATQQEWLHAILHATRDGVIERSLNAKRDVHYKEVKQVYYLSMEYLIGRSLSNSLIALGLYDDLAGAVSELGFDLDSLLELETDPGLGNGGLGRLAACFIDSLATLNLPGMAYGLRYEYGIFKQMIQNGRQLEVPDDWLEAGNPWEFPRNECRYRIQFGGNVHTHDNNYYWEDTDDIIAVAYDVITPGYQTNFANTLRLWSARDEDVFDLQSFNEGEHDAAVWKKNDSENLTRVLYPNDSTLSGKVLRLKQEYFLVSASIQNILDQHDLHYNGDWESLAEKVNIHLNDTHPVLAIPELIRLLLDHYHQPWDLAYELATKIFAYTNHTLMSEALETWSVDLFEIILPRHLQIIYEINARFLAQVAERFPEDHDMIRRVSIIDETRGRSIRMAWLATIVSHKVNGVSALHSDLMTHHLFADFAKIFPEKFCNVTNGITPRRWIGVANPKLAQLFDQKVGTGWRTDLEQLHQLSTQIDSQPFINSLMAIKKENKQKFSDYIQHRMGITLDPNSLFDVQVKRIHEYKRQLLNVLHVITRYNRMIANPDQAWVPRTIIFAGKAASSYRTAKEIIHLINDIANVINHDDRLQGRLKVLFVPEYNVSLAQKLIPAADLSEQISLAGTEASGTGNMKFALNGALTIGTMDGANVEMCEQIGEENLFIFGLRTHEVEEIQSHHSHHPRHYYDTDGELRQVLDQIANGFFNEQSPHRYRDLVSTLLDQGDRYLLLADYRHYIDVQSQVDALYQDPQAWYRKVAINISHMGMFSSDRSVRDYAKMIWKIAPIES